MKRPLDDISNTTNIREQTESTEVEASAAATSSDILTFEIEGQVDVQLTPQHTLYSLCDVVNQEWLATRSGGDYGVRAHLSLSR